MAILTRSQKTGKGDRAREPNGSPLTVLHMPVEINGRLYHSIAELDALERKLAETTRTSQPEAKASTPSTSITEALSKGSDGKKSRREVTSSDKSHFPEAYRI